MDLRIKKKIKVSKNKKKSWKKHTDISEFENFLDEKRFEERIGFSIIDAKDENLFKIDKKGNQFVVQNLKKNENRKKIEEKVQDSKIRKLFLNHRLFKKLEPTSRVPAITSKIYNQNKKKRTIHNDDDKLKKYWNDRKNFIEKGRKLKEEKNQIRDDQNLTFNNNYDLWDDSKQIHDESIIKVPVHLKQKPSLLPAVEVPLPAQSYNPDLKEHQELILNETNKEIKKFNNEKFWDNKVEKHFVSVDEAPNEKSWLKEMSQGLFEESDDQDEKIFNENEKFENYKIEKKIKNTDGKKRKKIMKQKLKEKIERKKREEKMIKAKENQVFRIKSIKNELNQREKKIEERARIRQAKKIQSLYKPKRLSKYRYQENSLELNLTSELSETLRSAKLDNNVLNDRFKSFQRRNLIEPRPKQLSNKRKYKLKKEIKIRHR